MLSMLKNAVSIESPSQLPNTQRPVFELFSSMLESMGYRCRFLSGKDSGGQMLAIPCNREKEQPQQLSPDEMIEQLPEFVRSGHFVQDLLSQSPYAQRWPGIWSGQQPAPTGGHNEFTEFPIAEEPPQHLS